MTITKAITITIIYRTSILIKSWYKLVISKIKYIEHQKNMHPVRS